VALDILPDVPLFVPGARDEEVRARFGVCRFVRWSSALDRGVLNSLGMAGSARSVGRSGRRPDQSPALSPLTLVQRPIVEVIDVTIDGAWLGPERGRHVEDRRERRRRSSRRFHSSRHHGLKKVALAIPRGAFDQNVFTQVHPTHWSPHRESCKEMTNSTVQAGVEIGPKTRSDCFIAEHGVPLWNRPVDPDDVTARAGELVRGSSAVADPLSNGLAERTHRVVKSPRWPSELTRGAAANVVGWRRLAHTRVSG